MLTYACAPSSPFREAQNLSAKPFDQLELAGNACGPAALLNSYRFGKTDWRKLSEEPPGLSDRERMRTIARGPAMRESASLPGRARWSKNGINISDLGDVANEISAGKMLPRLSNETLVISPIESPEKHLRRVHYKLANSLSQGVPPILSIRLFAKREGKWIPIQGHFVTVTSVPSSLAGGATSFPVKFIDPLGGKFREGRIVIGSDTEMNFFTEAEFPGVTIGRNYVRAGEEAYLSVAAVLGRF
ncbi:MAG: hypothetical protein NWT08_13130 [Akkermansiaceae bacterium]|nr:hypothetical protein [Akkermansiaceae bacterium]MDP4647706.1 hypothetical protein [Akkermansiaceae bacterium]MDP4722233.1 hypothetical protein [Akkermansiaceae bacterium]MDP4780274.1 hypothetical protein [Akkermansiaceae bacterium]MDP4846243.1 hypothetical protein [Akkermansiaceae bacterium]